MAKTKQDWLKEAKDLGLKIDPKTKISDIRSTIDGLNSKEQTEKSDSLSDGATQDTSLDINTSDTAKAGKRSKKAKEEAEEKAKKEARKKDAAEEEQQSQVTAKSGPTPVSRPLIERRSKNYRKSAEKIDNTKSYSLAEAVKLATDTSTVKFDATVELHIRLNVDPKQADQNIRDTVALPHGTGKTARVAVFAPEDLHAKAKSAGADITGEAEFLKQLDKEQLDFDVLIATPQVMSQLGKYAKLLGPKGLMPNPKSGTVTTNVEEAVKAAKAGRIEFRIDTQGIVHVPVGKVSFGEQKLLENSQAVLSAVKAARPANLKGAYIESIFSSSTMGPSIRVSQ